MTEEADDAGVDFTALPPEFFQPLDDFDAVQHMLSSLPDKLSPHFLTTQTQQTQVVLDAINSQLSTRVMRSYGAFVHGMAQVPRLVNSLRPFPRLAHASDLTRPDGRIA